MRCCVDRVLLMLQEQQDERPRVALLRPGAIQSDGPLAEDRGAQL